MIKNIKVIQGNPTEEELVALSLAIKQYLAQKNKKTETAPTSHWHLANKLGKNPSPWLSPMRSTWSYSERVSESWLD